MRLAIDGRLMGVALGAGAGTAVIEARTAPRPLFAGVPSSAPTDDGQRFLVATTRDGTRPLIAVVVIWQAANAQRTEAGTR